MFSCMACTKAKGDGGVKIVDLYNTSVEDMQARRWNPYLGISVRNKYFTQEAILEFTKWGVAHAHTRFALLIVDILQRINNEVFEKGNTAKAIEKAFRQSDLIREYCQQAVAQLPEEQRDKVVIVECADIVDDAYAQNRALVFDCFESCPEFRAYIPHSVSKNLGGIVDRLKDGDLETLCQYVLYEIPEFIRGFMHQGVHYNLCTYPGSITYLTRDLVKQDFFRPVYSRLLSYGPVAHAEMYVEA